MILCTGYFLRKIPNRTDKSIFKGGNTFFSKWILIVDQMKKGNYEIALVSLNQLTLSHCTDAIPDFGSRRYKAKQKKISENDQKCQILRFRREHV